MAEKNKVKFGLRNVRIASVTETVSTTGDIVTTYGTPKAYVGAVSLSLSPEGDTTKEYADDGIWFSQASNGGYSGTLEMETLDEDFEKNYLGCFEDDNGVIVEDSNLVQKFFAMTFQVSGDVHAKKYVLYRCQATRPDIQANTKGESVSFDHSTLNINVLSRPDDGLIKAHTPDGDTTSSTYTGWDTAIYVPTVTTN